MPCVISLYYKTNFTDCKHVTNNQNKVPWEKDKHGYNGGGGGGGRGVGANSGGEGGRLDKAWKGD